MQVTGTIQRIEIGFIPSKISEIDDRVVCRLVVQIEKAIHEDGAPFDASDLVGLHFQGPAELVDRFRAGDRVRIDTTTPTGFHIAAIEPAPRS